MKKENVVERCPKCNAEHTRGEFGEYKEKDSEGVEHIYACAPDIKCECGIELQWVVPLFCVSASGYILTPKPDHRNFRKAQ